jgi:SAM-dependent methyltransferase
MTETSEMHSAYTETADIETASLDYARRFAGGVGEYFLDVQMRAALEMISPWSGARVLDVGGGHAQIAAPLVKNGFAVTVTGSSNDCRHRLDEQLASDAYSFQICDMLSLPFEDSSFDIVTAFRLLPHVNHWRELISEMCRVASSVIIIDYPDIRSFNFLSERLFDAKKAIEGNTRPFRCFSRHELLAEFVQNSFTKFTFRPEFFFPMAIHRAVGSTAFSRFVESCSRLTGLTGILGSPVILRAVAENEKGV